VNPRFCVLRYGGFQVSRFPKSLGPQIQVIGLLDHVRVETGGIPRLSQPEDVVAPCDSMDTWDTDGHGFSCFYTGKEMQDEDNPPVIKGGNGKYLNL
jgi:hypothetical protein